MASAPSARKRTRAEASGAADAVVVTCAASEDAAASPRSLSLSAAASGARGAVLLRLPLGTSVPAFFSEERDPALLGEALQLGASAVRYARSAAQEACIRDLSETRTAELAARLAALEDQRVAAAAAAAEERVRADARAAAARAESDALAAEVMQRLREGHAAEVRHMAASMSQLRDAMAAQAEEHRGLVLRLDGELAAARADERARADAGRADLLRQAETARADAQRLVEAARAETTRQVDAARADAQCQAEVALSHARQEVAHLRTVIERQGAALDALRAESADHRSATERASKSLEGLLIMRGTSATKGAVGESTLAEMLTRAFGMADDFALRDSSRTAGSGDMMLRMWGLQTLWDCKSHHARTSSAAAAAAAAANASGGGGGGGGGAGLRNVEVREIDKIKADLAAHPEVDVGFLVALHTGIAHHAEHAVDVERVSPHQTLVYINRLALQEDPVRFLQDVLRPLLRALRALKEAVGMDAADRGVEGSAEEEARAALRRVAMALNTMVRDIETEKRDLADEKRQADARFAQRKSRLEERRAGLAALLASSHAAQLGAVGATADA